jgi:adenylate cyclase
MGYPDSGVGSEVAVGEGVVGVAARERTPIRIGHATSEYAYGRAIRESAEREGLATGTEIPPPGLADARSQLAVPIEAFGRLIGVIFADSREDLRFGYDDEDALVALAGHLGAAIHFLQQEEAQGRGGEPPSADGQPPGEGKPSDEGQPPGEAQSSPRRRPGPDLPDAAPLVVRHLPDNDSVFLGEDYLVKGVAGAIFWALVRDHVESGRTEFTNRELRLDPRIRLPDVADNLEARLILLRRRLDERDAGVRLERTGRGRFRLAVSRRLALAPRD